ncbi:MAG: LuxR C-terminal-related transcriptional regulator [Terriglobales bacterium]
MVALVGTHIRIIIVGNEPIPRSALRLLIGTEPQLVVVGECEVAIASGQVNEKRPDLALLHVASPNAAALAAIRAISPSTPVGVLTRQTHRAYVRSCLAAGARAYVLMTGAPADLFAAIRLAVHGHRFVDTALHDMLLDVLVNSGQQERSEVLSGRERQVLKMLAYGFTNQQIAVALSISRKSVDTYRQRIGGKLELRDRSEIVKYALATGLLTAEGLDRDDQFPSTIAGD